MVLDQILVELKSRLETIQVSNGYPFNVPKVVRPQRNSEEELTNYAIAIDASLEPNDEMSIPGNPPAQGWQANIQADIVIQETGGRPTKELQFEAYAAMVKAITSPASWHNWNGLAVDSAVAAPDLEAQEDNDGCQLELVVGFRTDENNLNNVR